MANLPPLYLCRHGQTDWNAAGRIQGQLDIPLNSLGRAQAQRNGRHLRDVLGASAGELDYLASPLQRARETMEIIRRELGLDPSGFRTDPRLMELHFGDWQGFTLQEIGAFDGPRLAERDDSKWHFQLPGESAESYEILAERVAPLFEELARPTLIVAHGGVSRAFLARFGGMPVDRASHAVIPQDRLLHAAGGDIAWV